MVEDEKRPKLEELDPVSDDEFVYRVVDADFYNPNDPQGRPIQKGAFPIVQFKGSVDSYGASVFVASKLPRGLIDLFSVNADWQQTVILLLPVVHMNRFNISVRLSPQDCDHPAIANAHASLTNMSITRPIRDTFLGFVQGFIHYKPQ